MDYDGGQYEDRSEVEFDWAPPQRTPVNGTTPVPGQEKDLAVRNGQVNNADLVVSFPLAWASGVATSAAGTVTASIRLYRVIDSGKSLLRVVSLAQLLINGELELVSSTMARATIVVARGLVGDGFAATITVPPLAPGVTLVAPGFGHRGATGRLWTWGCETSATPVGSTTAVGGVDLVSIVSPLPLPVSEQPVGAWGQQSGLAPDIGAGPAVALLAAPAAKYVEVSAANANAGILYVGPNAFVDPTGAAYELKGRESVRVPVNDAGLVFVAGSDGAENYLVAVV